MTCQSLIPVLTAAVYIRTNILEEHTCTYACMHTCAHTVMYTGIWWWWWWLARGHVAPMLLRFQIDILVSELEVFLSVARRWRLSWISHYCARFVLKSHVARLVGKFQGCTFVFVLVKSSRNYESAYPPYYIYVAWSLSHDDFVLSPPSSPGPVALLGHWNVLLYTGTSIYGYKFDLYGDS